MSLCKLLVKASAVGVLCAPVYALADAPASNLGIQGSYNKYSFSSDIPSVDDNRERVPKAGIFYNYGNKLTGQSGFIYQAGIEAKYGEKSSNEVKEARADLDLGLRTDLANNAFADFIVGGGYSWNRFEPDGTDSKLTNKSPFVKAAVALGHRGDNVTTRFEAGARYNVDGETKLTIDGLGSERVDMKNKANPYAELSMLWNRQGGLPVTTGLYYTRSNYELKDSQVVANTKLKNDEFGVKVGMLF